MYIRHGANLSSQRWPQLRESRGQSVRRPVIGQERVALSEAGRPPDVYWRLGMDLVAGRSRAEASWRRYGSRMLAR